MPADLSTTALVIGVVISLAAVAFGVHTWRRYKDMPMSREQMLEQQVADLTATVRTLQRDHVDDTQRITALENKLFAYEMEIRRLKAELEHYRMTLPTKVAYKPKKLNGPQLRVLRLALLDCYTGRGDWKMLLTDIGKDMDAVATGDNLEEIITKLLAKANDEGWIAELLPAAALNRPDSKALQELIAGMLPALGI